MRKELSRMLPSFLDVASWEARRCWASPSTRRIVLIAFGLFLLIVWYARHVGYDGFTIGGNTLYTFQVSEDSAWGAAGMLFLFTFLLAILLPFLNTNGVAHDVKSQTYELLMTTPISGRAYILGRYLFYLLASLGLALLLLVTLLLASLLFHLVEPGYVLPQVDVLLVFWLVAIFPITILLSSVSFALGTLLPRHANLVTMVPIVVWLLFFIELVFAPLFISSSSTVVFSASSLSTYQLWDPTNLGMEEGVSLFYQNQEARIIGNLFPLGKPQVNVQYIFANLQTLEQRQPDVLPWLLPHLVWASIGLMLVLGVAFTFKRFRTLLD